MVYKHVSHDQLSPGFWYIRTTAEPFYCVVQIMLSVYGDNEGDLVVYMIDEEREFELGAFGDDQFIGPVPTPF